MSHKRAACREVKGPDDRVLTIDVSGAADGTPVFLMHGTPGSRSGPRPRGSVLHRLGVRLVSYDRPGYGGSTRHDGRTVADAAGDVAAIARELEIERFSVVGRSGGGPHALACAALLPDRVVRTAVLVGIAPADAADLDWYQGMARSNVDEYTTADANSSVLAELLRLKADQTRVQPEAIVEAIRSDLQRPDLRVVDDVAIRRLLTDTYAEALREGPYGWIDDVFAFRKPWGFRLEDIPGPVRLWHGADDTFSPVSHTRWLASKIPRAEVQVQAGAAHFGAVEVLPEMLSWLRNWRPLVATPSA